MKNRHQISITFWASLARRAKDLITHPPVSIADDSTVGEAASFLIDSGLSIAPVINEAGRPVGVLSRTDIIRHQVDPTLFRNRTEEDESSSYDWQSGESSETGTRTGFAKVRDIMTPAVITVDLETPIEHVVHKLTGFEISHVFVVDEADVLVGVVSALDVLRSLSPCPR